MSAAHAWFTRVTFRFRNKYGYFACSGDGLLVFGFGAVLSIPIKRIRRCTRLRLMSWPSAFSACVSLREP
jgi:hypothetical protein